MNPSATIYQIKMAAIGVQSLTKCLEGLVLSAKPTPKPLKTEDTGKIFERAICLAYDIPYEGNYKYSMELPEKLKGRLLKLTELFPKCRHTARKQSRYDFTSVPELPDETPKHLSAKSTKKGIGKIAPQVIGQCKPEKFAELTEVAFRDIPTLKKHIQENIPTLLPIFMKYTFDCPNVYYHQKHETIKYITLKKEIEWDTFEYSWTRSWEEWGNSSILKIKKDAVETSLMEIQFHSKSRSNMAVRWFYDHLLRQFADHFDVVEL